MGGPYDISTTKLQAVANTPVYFAEFSGLASGRYTLVCSLWSTPSATHSGASVSLAPSLPELVISLIVAPVRTIQELIIKILIKKVASAGYEWRGSTSTNFTVDGSGNIVGMVETPAAEPDDSTVETPADEQETIVDTTPKPGAPGGQARPTDPQIPTDPDTADARVHVELGFDGIMNLLEDGTRQIPVIITNAGRSPQTFHVNVNPRRGPNILRRIGSQSVSLDGRGSTTLNLPFTGTSPGLYALVVNVHRGSESGEWLLEEQFDDRIRIADPIDLALGVSAPTSVDAGEDLTYDLRVDNAGPNRANSVEVELTLSHEVVVSSTSGDARSCSVESTTVTCKFSSVRTDRPDTGKVTVYRA